MSRGRKGRQWRGQDPGSCLLDLLGSTLVTSAAAFASAIQTLLWGLFSHCATVLVSSRRQSRGRKAVPMCTSPVRSLVDRIQHLTLLHFPLPPSRPVLQPRPRLRPQLPHSCPRPCPYRNPLWNLVRHMHPQLHQHAHRNNSNHIPAAPPCITKDVGAVFSCQR